MNNLFNSVTSLRGIGNSKAKLMSKLKINTIEDLIYYFPRGYKDKSQIVLISDTIANEYYTIKVIVDSMLQESRARSGLLIVKCRISDESGEASVIWFNNKYVKNSIKKGDLVLLHGKIKYEGKERIIESPEYEKPKASKSLNLMGIVPYYPSTEKLSQKDIRKAIYNAIEILENKEVDVFPEDFRKIFNLSEINFCISNIHFPEDKYSLDLAIRRFKFEELFMLQSGLIHIKKMNKVTKKGIEFANSDIVIEFVKKLPFQLTNAQNRVIKEIFEDMDKSTVMNRLVQGDVGSGKTIVAFLALYKCVLSGFQGMLMAPTEILAEQHYLAFNQLMEGTGIKVGLLSGGMKAKEKNNMYKAVLQGDIDVLIGTHALIQDSLELKNLGLVITDEQHRFGVRQRAVLAAKGKNPDMIVMTATPIPRTLSLILYGDLDVSVIDEMPPGRKKIDTYFINSAKKDRLFNFIRKELEAGRQAYIVCPLVEESEKLELTSAVEYSEYLKECFSNYEVGLLHGKMKADEKNKIMESYRNKKTNILVSTTVIEVGVNIPNASIMVIENAERFGLAQLHQLRGRVGRGNSQSYCILVSDSENEVATKRLRYMTKTENGFDIAEKDLEFRGGGEVLGQRQHGLPALKLADIIEDYELMKLSREAVEYLYDNDKLKELEYSRMKKILDNRFERILDFITLN